MFTDHDGIILKLNAVHCVPLHVGMLDDTLDDIWMQGVGDVKHVVPVAASALGVFVWEVLRHAGESDRVLV